MDDDSEKKKTPTKKNKKKMCNKKNTYFDDYKGCLFNKKIILKSQQRFKSNYHDVYTKRINKIALSSIDDNKLQTFDKITIYPCGTNAFKVCETEMLSKYK